MSKTERDLASDGSVDALDDLFDDAEFDDALESALEDADTHLRVDDRDAGDDAEIDAETPGAEVDEVVVDDADDSDADVDDDSADVEPVDDTALDDTALDDSVEVDDDVDDTVLDDAAEDTDDADADTDDVEAIDTVDVDSSDEDVEAADSGEYEFPEIVPATPDESEAASAEVDDPEAFVEEELHPDEVAEEILEELRRADIDGPQVEMAPQDESTAARRRPRRAVDYDPAPVPIPARVPRVLARKPRVRRVTRVVRHVDPWSVFKIAIVANLVLYIVVLTAGVLLWNVAHATGTVDNVERFFESFGWASFEFNGGEIYNAAWIAGLFVVIGLTGLAVLLATLFNLITDLVGGVRFTVLEEEVVETRTSPLRRFVVRRPEPEVPAKLSDQSGAMYREAVVDDTGANERPSR